MRGFLIVTASILLFFSFSSSASKRKEEAVSKKYKKETVLDFLDRRVEGERLRPHGMFLSVSSRDKSKSFIQYRLDFRDKLKMSLSEL